MQVSGIMAYLCINLGFAPFALVSLPFQGFKEEGLTFRSTLNPNPETLNPEP